MERDKVSLSTRTNTRHGERENSDLPERIILRMSINSIIEAAGPNGIDHYFYNPVFSFRFVNKLKKYKNNGKIRSYKTSKGGDGNIVVELRITR